MALRRSIRLLQNDLLFLVETFENFRFHAVRDAELYAELFLAVVRLGGRDLDGGLSLFVIYERGFWNHQDVFLFLEEDLSIGAHVSLELAAGVRNRDTHFEGGDVVLFLA